MFHLLEVAAISLAVFTAIALLLIYLPFDLSVDAGKTPAGRDFEQFAKTQTFVAPAAVQHYPTRDGGQRLYRQYGEGQDVLIFAHGSGGESAYLAGLATAIAQQTGMSVLTPDLYGHGPEPVTRGDVDYLDRQIHDLEDLATFWKQQHPEARVVVGGHSIGGGTALRLATGSSALKPDGVLLFSPFVHRKSPAARPDSGGWAKANIKRFAGIEMLHRLKVQAFDHLPVLGFAIKSGAADNATSHYSWLLYRSLTLGDNWQSAIAGLTCPVKVIAAEKDVIFNTAGYASVFAQTANSDVQVVNGVGHFDLVFDQYALTRSCSWLRDRFGPVAAAE